MTWLPRYFYPKPFSYLQEEDFTPVTPTGLDPVPMPTEPDKKEEYLYPVAFLRFLAQETDQITLQQEMLKATQTMGQMSDEQLEINFVRFLPPFILYLNHSTEAEVPSLREKCFNLHSAYAFMLTPLVTYEQDKWVLSLYNKEKDLIKQLYSLAETKRKEYVEQRRQRLRDRGIDALPFLQELRKEMYRDEKELLLREAYLECYTHLLEENRVSRSCGSLNLKKYPVPLTTSLSEMSLSYYLDEYAPGFKGYCWCSSTTSGVLEIKIGRLAYRCRFLLIEGSRVNRKDLSAIQTIMLKVLNEHSHTPKQCLEFIQAMTKNTVKENRSQVPFLQTKDFLNFMMVINRHAATS